MVLLGNGDGTLAAAASVSSGDMPYGIALGDFNGDGRLDPVWTNVNASTVSVLLQQ